MESTPLTPGPNQPVYTVATPDFEGPLDLLLHLIERAELDITRVSLAKVTDQYLGYLDKLQHRNPEEVSSFLVVAARLIQIKSEALLPRPPVREPGEEDPGEALARQLLLYKRYKEISEWLKMRDEAGQRTYLRLAPVKKPPAILDLDGIGLPDLIQAAQAVLSSVDPEAEIQDSVTAHRVTVREKIRQITETLKRRGRATFQSLLRGPTKTRIDVVVTFLAILELVKLRRLVVMQEGLFADIELEPAGDWEDEMDLDLEFDD